MLCSSDQVLRTCFFLRNPVKIFSDKQNYRYDVIVFPWFLAAENQMSSVLLEKERLGMRVKMLLTVVEQIKKVFINC